MGAYPARISGFGVSFAVDIYTIPMLTYFQTYFCAPAKLMASRNQYPKPDFSSQKILQHQMYAHQRKQQHDYLVGEVQVNEQKWRDHGQTRLNNTTKYSHNSLTW